MPSYDINKILAEYGDNDFGFSAISEEEYNSVINEKDETVENYKHRLAEVEKIIDAKCEVAPEAIQILNQAAKTPVKEEKK